MKEKEVGIMVKEKKEGGLELHLFPSKEARAGAISGVGIASRGIGRPLGGGAKGRVKFFFKTSGARGILK